MLASIEPEGDFSAGYAGRRIGHLLFATHPLRLTLRELTIGGIHLA
jgi:hypothetical protein